MKERRTELLDFSMKLTKRKKEKKEKENKTEFLGQSVTPSNGVP